MKLADIHNESCAIGVESMLQRNSCPSFFRLEMADGTVKTMPTPWDNNAEKRAYIAGIRLLLQEFDIKAYSFVTEAWFAVVEPHQQELKDVAPSNRSDREDVLMILSRNRKGTFYTTKYVVDYNPDGKVSLGKPEHMKYDFSEGLMGNLYENDGSKKVRFNA